MTRAHGRNSMGGRRPQKNNTGRPVTHGEEAEIGLTHRQDGTGPEGSPIPGLTGNILNVEVERQQPAVPDADLPYFRGMMAHGVDPDEGTGWEHADSMRGPNAPVRTPKYDKEPDPPIVPVPVFIVDQGSSGNSYISAYPRHITVPNSNSDAVRICGRSHRNRIGLLNEDTATNIRFGQKPQELINGGGALLPWVTNTYSWFETQDELYAVTTSTTLTVVLSIIEEFTQEVV